MRILLGVLILLMVLGAAIAESQPAKPRQTAKTTLTGCVDQRDGVFVLTGDTNLEPVARLKPAAGSPEDNFARHLGHKVKLRGVLSTENPLPTLTVENVALVSETCTPSGETDKP